MEARRTQRELKPHSCGPMRVWRMSHYYDVCEWEVEQAAELGWVRILSRESRCGPPVRVAELSCCADAKVPPPRRQIKKAISWRHQNFAMQLGMCAPRGASFGPYRLGCLYEAYLRSYPGQRSKVVARVATARLMRRRGTGCSCLALRKGERRGDAHGAAVRWRSRRTPAVAPGLQ